MGQSEKCRGVIDSAYKMKVGGGRRRRGAYLFIYHSLSPQQVPSNEG
jgi:hypothetical protein